MTTQIVLRLADDLVAALKRELRHRRARADLVRIEETPYVEFDAMHEAMRHRRPDVD